MAACPVCETDNPLTAVECAGCGKVLRRPTEVPGFAPPIDGLDQAEGGIPKGEPDFGLGPGFWESPGEQIKYIDNPRRET